MSKTEQEQINELNFDHKNLRAKFNQLTVTLGVVTGIAVALGVSQFLSWDALNKVDAEVEQMIPTLADTTGHFANVLQQKTEDLLDSLIHPAAPIGVIVPSLLNYKEFLEVNGLSLPKNEQNAIWVPCDGRQIGKNKGTYGAFFEGVVPDLRGLFLRGVNDMGNAHSTTPHQIQKHKNPDNKHAGEFQADEFKEHRHKGSYGYYKPAGVGGESFHLVSSKNGQGRNDWSVQPDGGHETRPKNLTVYYYIKIK